MFDSGSSYGGNSFEVEASWQNYYPLYQTIKIPLNIVIRFHFLLFTIQEHTSSEDISVPVPRLRCTRMSYFWQQFEFRNNVK